ncbi:MAG: YraN family protein [Roseovarius sp.]
MTHYDPSSSSDTPITARKLRGKRAFLAGMAAEDVVERHYTKCGAVQTARRWRGKGGEIDLIYTENDVIVFVEVKKARSFDAAVHHLTEAQMYRIHAAASEYLGHTEKGQLSEVRFDLALVNETGEVRITQNAFGHF